MRFSRKCFDSITYMTMTTTREEISDKQTIISFERERERERDCTRGREREEREKEEKEIKMRHMGGERENDWRYMLKRDIQREER